MNNRVLKYVALLIALVMAVGVGAAVGGGIVYAAMKIGDKVPQVAAAVQVDPESGIVVVSVDPEGPGAEAGVVRGDILLAIDGAAVDDLGDLFGQLEEREPGEEVELTVLHGDEERTLTATLDEQGGRPYLGLMSCRGLLGMPRIGVQVLGAGAMVIEVMADSPAEQAGLQIGDRITAVDGQDVDAENDLADLVVAHDPGDTVALEVTRPGEKSREVTVELGEHPEEEGKAYLGIGYLPFPHVRIGEEHELPFHMPEFDEEHFRIHPGSEIEQGAIIREVVEDSPAAAAGLGEGDVITAIDGEPVESPRALADTIAGHEPGETVTLTVVRPDEEEGEEQEVEVTLAEHPDKEGAAYLGVVIGGYVRMHRFEGEGLPPKFERPDKLFKFRERLDKLPFDFDFDFEDAPRRFEFRFPPYDFDFDHEIEERFAPPGDSV